MKTILVDAVNVFVIEGEGVNNDLYHLLESYPNPKLIVTGANQEQIKQYGLDALPYPLFTCAHNPEKSEPEYFKILMRDKNLKAVDLVYFDHREAALKSAKQVGITTYFYNPATKDMLALKSFLDAHSKQ